MPPYPYDPNIISQQPTAFPFGDILSHPVQGRQDDNDCAGN